MKKIALVTCYVDNYGACLQAFALQKTLIDIEGNCDIIRYSPYKEYHKPTLFFSIVEGLKDIRRLCKYRNYSYTLSRKKCFRAYRKSYLLFSETWYNNIEELYSNPPAYDAFVTGSDQLWNPLIHNNSNNKAYFLDFVPEGKKRIAYAPSIGVSSLPDEFEFKDEMAQMLKKFDAISTREKTGADIVEQLIGQDCRVVLDPTLLLDRDIWSEIARKPDISEPYIFCYLFGDPDYIGQFVQYAEQKTGYKVVVIPFHEREYNSSHMKIKKAGPLEFIGLIKNAALVITDSFHATAFSINFNVPFYSLLRNTSTELNNMNSRITNILSMVGLENRLIMSSKDFPDEINIDIDFTAANHKLSKRRDEDITFLRDAIGGVNTDAKKTNM